MVGKAKVFTDDSANIASLQRNKLATYATGRDNPDGIGATQFSNAESSGISSIGGINSDKTKLPLDGGLIRGNLGFEIATIRLVVGTNVLQLDEDDSGVKIPFIHDTNIVTLDTGTTGTLTTIKGAQRDGQRLRLLGVAGNEIVITHTVAATNDTITCPENTNGELSNDEVVDLVYEVISDTLGRWRLLGGGGGGGEDQTPWLTDIESGDFDLNMRSGNITFGSTAATVMNATSTLMIQTVASQEVYRLNTGSFETQNGLIIRPDDDGLTDLADITHRYLNLYVASIKIDSDRSFNMFLGGANMLLQGTNDSYTITIESIQKLFMSSTQTTLSGNVDILADLQLENDRLLLHNPASTFNYQIRTKAILADRVLSLPLLLADDELLASFTAGVMSLKTINADINTITNIGATEIKSDIISGQTSKGTPVNADEVLIIDSAAAGALKRVTLTDLLGGGGGANQQLSNLAATVNINLDLLPNLASGGNFGSVSASKQWFNAYVDRYHVYNKIIFEDTGTLTTTNNEIVRTSSSVLEYNVPSSGAHRVKIGGSVKLLIETTQMVCSSTIFAVEQTSAIPHLFINRLGSTTDDMEIGRITFSALDSVGSFHEWARISGHIVDNNSGDREGMLKIEVAGESSGELQVFMTFNEEEDQLCIFRKRAQMLLSVSPARFAIGLDVNFSEFDGMEIAEWEGRANDSSNNSTDYCEIRMYAEDVTNGTEDGSTEIWNRVAGTITRFMTTNDNSNALTTFYSGGIDMGVNKVRIRPTSGNVLGFFVEFESGTVGDGGTVQIPEFINAAIPSNSTLNTFGGSFDGAMVFFRDSDTPSGSRLYVRGSDGNWYFEVLTQQT